LDPEDSAGIVFVQKKKKKKKKSHSIFFFVVNLDKAFTIGEKIGVARPTEISKELIIDYLTRTKHYFEQSV